MRKVNKNSIKTYKNAQKETSQMDIFLLKKT